MIGIDAEPQSAPEVTTGGVHDYPAEVWVSGRVSPSRDHIADETPIALVYNGISHAVMLATPGDLKDFGIGFTLSEGIVHSPHEIRDVEFSTSRAGIEVNITIGSGSFAALKERRRNLAGRTGCGLCGTESLEQVLRPVPVVRSDVVISAEALHRAFHALGERQHLHALTGAIHAAGWSARDGTLTMVREDVGRHNALDKLIGALARRQIGRPEGFVVLTSRASSEMVQKAATVGMPIVAAISAPTGLAIDIAHAAGVTLIGFVRNDRHVIYARGDRVAHPGEDRVR